MGHRQFLPLISPALCLEHEDVLRRPGTVPGYTPDQITRFLDSFLSLAKECRPRVRLRPFLKDPDDELVFECALAGGATHLVTHNRADFAGVERFGISVVTPDEFLTILRRA